MNSFQKSKKPLLQGWIQKGKDSDEDISDFGSSSKKKRLKKEEEDVQSKISDMEVLHKELEMNQKQLDWTFKENQLDFQKKLFPQWQQQNAINSPYTYTLMEDAMYVDEGVIITLQYHIFNQEQDHILLSSNEQTENHQNIQKVKSKLNTENYQKQGAHPMSIFCDEPINLLDNNQSFETNHQIGTFMTAEEKELDKKFKIEGVLCFW